MDTLVLNGKTYVRASKAARNLGYTSDYVGQLCRSGNVDAHLVGRTWYVHEDELSQHRVEKKRNARVKAREQAHKALEEHRINTIPQTQNTYKKLAIRYEPDQGDLIPKVEKKLSVVSFKPAKVAEEVHEEQPSYQLENEGNKVLMSGVIDVVDAEEEELYGGFTVLTPKVMRKRRPTTKANAEAVQEETSELVQIHPIVDSEQEESDGASISINKSSGMGRISFEERLMNDAVIPLSDSQNTEQGAFEATTDVGDTSDPVIHESDGGRVDMGSPLGFVTVTVVVMVLSVASLFVESNIVIESGVKTSSFSLNFETVMNEIRSKI
jgi:hypothetical protein